MRALNERLATDLGFAADYARAHDRYRRLRDGNLEGKPESAGGMPGRVKCLHALYAHHVADANPVGAIVQDRIDPVSCPGQCVHESDGEARRVEGHPGYRKRR